MQMLKALDYIHKASIAHRDIKAENFMLSEPSVQSNIKMIDFGMATKFKPDQVLTELCGSPHYLSPELIGQKYNHSADVWAFGVLMYLLMYGHYPYDAKHPRDIMVKILTEPIKWESKAKLSKDAIDFLKKLLEHNTKKRLTAEQALDHSWLSKRSESGEGELLNPEAPRSAHKKITANKKTINPEIEQIRNEKLQKIEEDYGKGIRHGHRLGATPKEDFMSKPEFVRRENKITTAPSGDLNSRRTSISKLLDMVKGKSAPKENPGGLQTITDDDANYNSEEDQVGDLNAAPAANPIRKGRSQSLTDNPNPRRLSYLTGITKTDEQSFVKLFEEKKKVGSLDEMSGVLPGATPQKGKAAESPL